MIKKVLRALGKDSAPSLEVLNGVAEGKKIYFTEDLQEVIIGRDPEQALCIDETVISRQHAKLVRKWGGIVLQDLESRNGCYVNNEKVQEKLLRDGDKVMFGTIKLIYRNPQDVNIEAIGQEISRKKREAALRESELMEVARQKKEEEEKTREEEEKATLEKNELSEEKEAKEDIKGEAEQKEGEAGATPVTGESKEQLPASTIPSAAVISLSQVGLSTLEKVFIGLGGLVLLVTLVLIVGVLLK